MVTPAPQSKAPRANLDDVVLHIAARYLVPRHQPEAGNDVDDELVPLQPTLGESRSGQWRALPSEDWLVLKPAQWKKLLPERPAKVGDTWDVDRDVAALLLTRIYPTTENNDLTSNRIEEQRLQGTIVSLKDGVVQARLHGKLTMQHSFYPRRQDQKRVEAALLGYVEFQTDTPRLRTLRLVTDRATYGGPNQYFGAAARLVSPRADSSGQ